MRTIEDIYKEIESAPDFAGHRVTSVGYRNGCGDTPLHIVSNWGDCEAIELLVSSSADLNAVGKTGFTPLHCAVEQNKTEAIKLLLQLGAKIIPDANGQTPLELAKILGNTEATNAFSKNI